tara:strand:+ start:997 stop:1464 length:468 start_codon:yes stop_codon:yes gene_type:complete
MSNLNEVAKDFTLKNTSKEDVSLSQYKGKPVVLAFYPGAFTGVCDTEMCSFRDSMDVFNNANATVLGISVDSPWANSAFSSKYNLNFTLLSDVHRNVITEYDVAYKGLGGIENYITANRAVFVLDSECLIKYKWVAESPGVEPNYEEIMEIVNSL